MSFMQQSVNFLLQKRVEYNELVDATHKMILNHDNVNEAFEAFLDMCKNNVYPYRLWSGSTPFSEYLPFPLGESPFDDFYMDRGQNKSWSDLYESIQEKIAEENTSDAVLDKWKRAVIESKSTHYEYDW